MAISATLQAGGHEPQQEKKIKNEMPTIKLVPVKMPLKEMTLEDKKRQIMEEKEPFYVAAVFDGSTSTSIYSQMVQEVAGGLKKDFEGNFGSEISTEFLPTDKYGSKNDLDNYASFFENLLQGTLNNCSIIIYGDLDPGGQGAVDPALADSIVQELKKRNIKIYVVFLEDKKQEKQEKTNSGLLLKSWEGHLRSAKRNGSIKLDMYFKDDKGRDRFDKTETFTPAQCQQHVDEIKHEMFKAEKRVETMQKICGETGGKLIAISDNELSSFKKSGASKKQEYIKNVQSLILDVIITEQLEGGN